MNILLNQLSENKKQTDTFSIINAILYNIQSDTISCRIYLETIILLFKNLFQSQIINYHDQLFPFLKNIIFLVGTFIQPYSDTILKINHQFLNKESHLLSLKTLSTLIFSLKSEFQPYFFDTYQIIIKLLDFSTIKEIENYLYLLFILTLLTLICYGPYQFFSKYITESINQFNLISNYSIKFLSQVIFSCKYFQLAIPTFLLIIPILKIENQFQPQIFQLCYLLLVIYKDILIQF